MDNLKNAAEQSGDAFKGMSPEQILEFAQSSGFDLSDEQLEEISGGGYWSDDEPTNTPPVCPFCRQSGTLEFRPNEVWCRNCFSSWKKR